MVIRAANRQLQPNYDAHDHFIKMVSGSLLYLLKGDIPDMKNPVIESLGDDKYYIGLDYSGSNGILHFTHEISVWVHKDSDSLEILDADEINSGGWFSYTSKELEDEYPGIIKTLEEILTNYENSK